MFILIIIKCIVSIPNIRLSILDSNNDNKINNSIIIINVILNPTHSIHSIITYLPNDLNTSTNNYNIPYINTLLKPYLNYDNRNN